MLTAKGKYGLKAVVHLADAEPRKTTQAIDIAKASGMVCVRTPHEDKPGKRVQRVFHTAATSGAILDLADHLVCQGVTLVVMEATSTYWKPFFFLLEARGLRCWLVNARDVKNVPGRPKTDKLDSVWLAKLAERGDIDPSERVVLVITGEGLKTLDAVRDSFQTTTIAPTVEAFESAVGEPVSA